MVIGHNLDFFLAPYLYFLHVSIFLSGLNILCLEEYIVGFHFLTQTQISYKYILRRTEGV